MRTMFFISVLTFLAGVSANADEFSGPREGSTVAALKVYASTGEFAGKEIDIAKEREGKQTVFVFVPHERFDRPVARLLKALEKSVVELDPEASLVTVFLTDDADKTKDHLPRIQQSLQFTANSLVVFPSTKESPEHWSINQNAMVTIVVVKKGIVRASLGYRSANETLAPEIVTAMKQD